MITILTNSVNNEEKLELTHESISSLPNFLELCLIGATSIVFISVCLVKKTFNFICFKGVKEIPCHYCAFFHDYLSDIPSYHSNS